MKTVILAGGLGSRLGEETQVRPKPMVEIGGRPIIWHIMKIYSAYGLNDFVICLGYKGYMIKEYFSNYFLHMSDVTIDLGANSVEVHQNSAEPWRVTLVDTGEETQTGGRLKAVGRYLTPDEPFCFTYGDGLAALDIAALIAFHQSHGKLATITSVAPPGRFGALEMNGDFVTSFREKPAGDGGRINGGFFVLQPSVLDLIEGPGTYWEREPMEALAGQGELMAWRHDGYWGAMDTLRDRSILEQHWASGVAPWKCW
ncbi:MAG TPA: glucose-1-phosphate cytidylyltransferase [Caulobacteraceae bacterium]